MAIRMKKKESNFSFKLTLEEKKRIRDLAMAGGLNVSDYVRAALNFYVKFFPKPKGMGGVK